MNRFTRYYKKHFPAFSNKADSFILRLAAATIIINILVYAMTGFWLYKDRQDYHQMAEITTRNMARVIESNICGIFNRIDTGLFALKFETEKQLYAHKINKEELDSYIGRLLKNLPELFDISVADEKGDVLYGTDIVAGKSVNIKDRDYFKYIRENPAEEMVISNFVHGQVSGRWLFVLARRINHSDGTFAGTAIGMFDVNYFDDLLSSLQTGENGIILIINNELKIIALKKKKNGRESLIGSKILSQKTSDLIIRNTAAATYKLVVPYDNIERMTSLSKTNGYPFYIIASSAVNDYIRPWKNEALFVMILASIFTLASIFSSRFIYKSRESRLLHFESKQYAEEMQQQNEELNNALARVKRLEGIIPICSYCKKIRNEQQSWEQLEKYFTEHSDALFSHGICPECAQKIHEE
ncbi:MAG: hypothetical protein JW864_02625 [Spirochaetes bacterium]|nr:hypothetical protein [Spirochaetota bacterium]